MRAGAEQTNTETIDGKWLIFLRHTGPRLSTALPPFHQILHRPLFFQSLPIIYENALARLSQLNEILRLFR